MLSLTGAFGIAASYGIWADLLNSTIAGLLENQDARSAIPWIVHFNNLGAPSASVLFFLLAVIWIVNRGLSDPSIANEHSEPIRKHFPDPSFEEELAVFCSALKQDLVSIDRQTNWSPQYYTHLEAEVEVLTGSWERRRIVDLQKAIQADRKSQAFLVLGDPGSGKSVALRNLAHNMLAEVPLSRRVPVYVNLREWLPVPQTASAAAGTSAWTETNMPTVAQLEAFVIASLKARGDVFIEDFVDRHFRDLWRNGYLFFIFDSFDEIPQLLDVDEESWLIDALSRTLSQFVVTHPQSRGIVASRLFRRPTRELAAEKILDIRPFSEERISQALSRFPRFTHDMKAQLFRERPDLLSIARNPFLMTLLGIWVEEHGTLPDTQAQLYESYLRSRLARCQSRLDQHGLSPADVVRDAAAIALFLFRSPEFGLEAPARVIVDRSGTSNARAVMDILSFARIARVSGSDSKSFSFVHRRFLEYLVTTQLVCDPTLISSEHIPTDSRGRDALVLYAQVCEEPHAKYIANLCWGEVLKHFEINATRMRAIHCLRFLADAFRSRREVIGSFGAELAEFIQTHIGTRRNVILSKICLEAVGLLPANVAESVLGRAIASNNAWLQETAFRACRQLPRINNQLKQALTEYVVKMPLHRFWRTRRSLIFSLSLSDALLPVHRISIWRARNTALLLVAVPLIAVITPYLFALIAIAGVCGILIVLLMAANFDLRLDRPIWIFEAPLRLATAAYLAINAFNILLNHPTSSLLWPWSAEVPGSAAAAYLMVLLALVTPDWLSIWRFATGQNGAFSSWEVAKEMGQAALVVASAVLVMWFLDRFLGLSLSFLTAYIEIFAMICVASAGLLLLYGARQSLYQIPAWFHQRRRLIKLRLPNQLHRAEIAAHFRSFHFEDIQLGFVRKLAQRRTLATGEWPVGFELGVSPSQSLTELAKLEEQWLRLDR